MRFRLLALALVSSAAFANEPAAADAPVAKAAAPVTPSASQSVAVAASAPEPERKRVCRREETTGSSLMHTVCRVEQTEAERAQGLSDLRNQVDRVIPTHH